MAKSDETNISNAIQSVKSGTSVSKSAAQWGVPRSTLRHRLKGATTHAAAAESMQRLSKRMEESLCSWVLIQKVSGDPPTQKQLKEVATRLLVSEGDLQPLGKNWAVGFLRRNPHIRTAMASAQHQDENGTVLEADEWQRALGIGEYSTRRRSATTGGEYNNDPEACITCVTVHASIF